jgi:tetratricopeptide (TPR) repeat protein
VRHSPGMIELEHLHRSSKMFSKLILFLLFFCVFVASTSAHVKNTSSLADLHYSAAVRFQQSGKLSDAIAEYKHAIQKRKDEPSFYYGLATAFQAQHKLDSAIQNYSEALSLKPQEPMYQRSLEDAKHAKAAPFVDSGIKKQTSTPPDIPGAIADYNAALSIIEDSVVRSNLNAIAPYSRSDWRFHSGMFIQRNGEPNAKPFYEESRPIDSDTYLEEFLHGNRQVLYGYDVF